MLHKLMEDLLNTELSIEQKFNLAIFKTEVDNMELDKAKETLIIAYEKLMMLDNMNKKYAKHLINLEHGNH